MMYRDKNLLDLAEGQPCLIRKYGVCRGDNSGVVAAHSNFGEHGKGRSLKAEDCYSVWGCYRCHSWLDTSAAPYEEKVIAFEAAFRRQIVAWQAIAKNICLKPVRVNAAREVLEYLKTKGEVA